MNPLPALTKSYEEDSKVKLTLYFIVLLFLFSNIEVIKYQREKMIKWSSQEFRLRQKFSYWEKATTRSGDSARAGIG